MLDQETLNKIKAMQLRAGFLASELLAGAYESAFKGQGMEFDEVREYSLGDDVRSINWRVTARMQAPYVKVMREERESTLLLMIDVSASMRLGTTGRTKQDVAAELAAILAYLAIRSHDKVGLLVFSDHIEKFIPPRKGRGHIWQIIRAAMSHDAGRHATDISAAAEYARRILKRRSTIFVISDFLTSGWEQALGYLRARHEVVGVTVSDPREAEMPAVGIVELFDSESGRRILVDTSARGQNTLLAEEWTRCRQATRQALFKAGIDQLTLSTAGNPVHELRRYFLRRERPRRRR